MYYLRSNVVMEPRDELRLVMEPFDIFYFSLYIE